MATESVERLLDPSPVDFVDALLVAVIGLIVNLVSAALLSGGGHHHHHGHGHDHGHDHGHAPAPAPPEEHAHRDTGSYAPVATAAAAPAPMASTGEAPVASAALNAVARTVRTFLEPAGTCTCCIALPA